MSKVTEALIRRDNQDIIYIGEVAQRLYNGQGGELLRAIINGHIQQESRNNEHGIIVPSDMVLGRVQAYQTIIDDIETMIEQKEKLITHQEGDEIKEIY